MNPAIEYKSTLFSVWEPDPAGVILGTRFMRFECREVAVGGLARDNEAGTIKILAVESRLPQAGHMRRFIELLKAEYQTICVWHIGNPILYAALVRYGFQPEETADEFGDRLSGLRWDRP